MTKVTAKNMPKVKDIRRTSTQADPEQDTSLKASIEGTLLPHDLAPSSWEEPNLDAVEATVRAGLLKQGRDPEDVLRRAAKNLQRAEEGQGMTDAEVQRAVGWVLGRS